MTRTPTQTFTPSATATVTPAATEGPNRVVLTIYTSSGEVVCGLPAVMDVSVVHDLNYNSPFISNGASNLVISDGEGHVLGSWNGKASNGQAVMSGIYYIQAVTTDAAGNKFVVQEQLDVIYKSSYSADNLKFLDQGGTIHITGSLTNASHASVSLYNINAELIRRFPVADPANIDILWDRKTTSGQSVAGGIFAAIIEIRDAGTGRTAIEVKKFAAK